MNNQTNDQVANKRRSFTESNFAKILTIGFLSILLFIPTLFVSDLISERATRYEEVGKEIASKWADPQTIQGAIIAIPYKKVLNNVDEDKKYLYFLPENVSYDVQVNPVTKSRGMYETVVYDGNVKIDGNFELNLLQVNKNELDLSKAVFLVGVSDMKGIAGEVAATVNGQNITMLRTTGGPLLAQKIEDSNSVIGASNDYDNYSTVSRGQANDNGLYTQIDLNKLAVNNFTISIPVKGSKDLSLVPVGKNTSAKIASSWTHPSFNGMYLPDSSDDNGNAADGFVANWQISEFNSSKPGIFTQSLSSQAELENLANQAFGVAFRQPVDFYQKSERAVKYAMLFIILTFVTFFCFEILGSKKKIHPIQYLFIGAALVMFYVLLIAFAEYIGFGLAYLLGAFMTTALVTWYSSQILKSKSLTLSVAGLLTFIYGYLYVLLQTEEKTLLIGAISLFIVLAIVMYVTRNVDWYGGELVEK